MFRRKIAILGFVLMGLGFLSVQSRGFSESAQAQNFPYQFGFPRLEPASIAFGSPSIVDINGDGHLEILLPDGSGCVWAWSRTGQVLANYPLQTRGSCQGGARINGPLAIGDIDGDGNPEIAAGTRGVGTAPGQRGRVFVWNANGSIVNGWPKEMAWNVQFGSGMPEVYTVAMDNVWGNAALEIIAGTSNNSSNGGTPNDPTHNLYVYHSNGAVLSGFPTEYRRAGIWGFVGTADVNNDGYAEIFTGRDHSFVHAYNNQGQQTHHWPVAAHVYNHQPRGLFMEFTRDAPSIGDIDNDGILDIVIVGKVRDPNQNRLVTNSAVMVLRPNGGRKPGWFNAKLSGAPLSAEYPPTQAPALADLNGNGRLEIVAGLLDGTMRAYRADGSQMWRYDFAQGHVLFASEPVIGDVNGDGSVDIVFGVYSPDNSSNHRAGVYALNASGQLLPGFPLSLTHEGNAPKQGIRAAPTLADIDRDCDVEIVAGSQAGVLYVWDLPTAYNPQRMPWPTARHDFQRTGFVNTVDNSNWALPSNC